MYTKLLIPINLCNFDTSETSPLQIQIYFDQRIEKIFTSSVSYTYTHNIKAFIKNNNNNHNNNKNVYNKKKLYFHITKNSIYKLAIMLLLLLLLLYEKETEYEFFLKKRHDNNKQPIHKM